MEALRYNSSGSAGGAPVDVVVLGHATMPNASASEYNGEYLKCAQGAMPSVNDYLQAINVVGFSLFGVGAVTVFFILYLYVDTLRFIMRRAPGRVKTHTAIVVSVYPVVGIACYVAMIVPRAQLLAEAITQGIFMVAMYQLFCLLVAYCGGETELIQRVKPNPLDMRVGPCCCYPCCCFPQLQINKRNVKFLRVLVLQLPIVQGLIYAVLLVMWAEEESLYQVNYMYLQPIAVLSILTGIWGVAMTLKMLAVVLKDYSIQAKFFVLQMVMLLAKFQGLTARIVVWTNWVPCAPTPLSTPVYSYLVYNTATLVEMLILGFIARRLYKMDLPVPEIKPSNTIHVIRESFKICIENATEKTPTQNNNNNNNNYYSSNI